MPKHWLAASPHAAPEKKFLKIGNKHVFLQRNFKWFKLIILIRVNNKLDS